MYTQGYKPANPTPQQPQQPYTGYTGAWYQPVQPTGAVQQPARTRGSSGGRPPRKSKKRKKQGFSFKKFLILLILAAIVGFGGYLGIRFMIVRSAVEPYIDRFADGVTVDGIDLTGMSKEQGYAAVYARASQNLNSWYVRLRSSAGEYKDITAQTLGLNSDPTAALDEAWRIGHETNATGRKTIYQLQDELNAAKSQKPVFSTVSPNENADTTPIDQILSTLERVAYRAPKDAVLTGFNPDAADPFTIQREEYGQMLDISAIKDQIYQMVSSFTSGEILLSPTPIAPSLTTSELRKTVELRNRSTTPIDRHSTAERNDNIRVAFSKINGIVMHDGEKFSFNSRVGRRTEKNGFLQAFEYSYGELVTGWGGGVCQASTTVYLAAIQSGLKITDRTAHSTPVSYTDMGKDATVSDTRGREIDFVFRNNTGGDIYMCAHVINDPNNKNRLMCEVRIYGPSLGNVRYELETEVAEKLEKPTEPEYVRDTNAKYVTYVDEEKTVIEASEGYVINVFLCTIDNGVQTGRTLVSTDTYKNRAERIYVGVTPRY